MGGAGALTWGKTNTTLQQFHFIDRQSHEVALQGWWHMAQTNKKTNSCPAKMEVTFSFSAAHKTTRFARFVIDGHTRQKMDAVNKTHALQNWQQRHGGWWIGSDYSSWWTISIRAACASSIPRPKRRRRMLTTDGNLHVSSSAAEIDCCCDSDCVKVNHCWYFIFFLTQAASQVIKVRDWSRGGATLSKTLFFTHAVDIVTIKLLTFRLNLQPCQCP